MRLLAFGDSFVLGAGDPYHLGWVGRTVLGRTDVTLYNMGVRGNTSGDVAARWRREASDRVVSHEPLRLVFSYGCNDCALQDGALRVEPAETLKNTQIILAEAAALAPVLMVGPPPVPDPLQRARIASVGDALRILAGQLRVPYLDVFTPLRQSGVWEAEAAAGDGAHPGADGYQQLADLVMSHPSWRAFVEDDKPVLTH
ncbi:MAG: GDSL-type esterase/lipase family protein [Phenylobacterium sp.]|uniref:GDSL-type esterase/lipase family protein n=1 Tax=Phenylobacterium sp. TaxID=1871053 RepID=UPI00391BDE45